MKKLPTLWTKRMAAHIVEHRQKFNEASRWFSQIRVRHFAGHDIFRHYLNTPLRIAHLTDQHVGRVTPMRIQKEAIKFALETNPDVVVLTGDFVCHSELYLHDLTEIMNLIALPKFAVLGNHDHWTNALAVKKALIKGGVEVLENANTVLEIKGERLQLVGLDDSYTNHADINKSTRGMKKGIATLGLSHIAEQADKLWLKNVPLVLSGHTHAGQITVAGLHELILNKVIGHKYIHGFYGNLHLDSPLGAVYVSAGIGAAVMPLRMGEKGKREVAIFDLGADPFSLANNFNHALAGPHKIG